MLVLKLLLFLVIHHSNILIKSYTMLRNWSSKWPFQIFQMCMCSYKIIDFSCEVFLRKSPVLKREA